MSLIKIGNKILAFSQSYLIPENEELELQVPIEGWLIKLFFTFQSTENEKDRGIRIEASKDAARFIFNNWDNTLGTATIKPVEFGKHQNGKTLFLMASNHSIGSTNMLNVQILLGGENG